MALLLGHELPAAQTARDFLAQFHAEDLPLLRDRDAMVKLVDELIGVVGRDSVVLSTDYAQGNRLDQLIEDTVGRISNLLEEGTELSAALTAFSADRAVRIMSIHKSKGLEFDTVIMMGVEEETFWGKIDEER